jgi:outer membrane protein assembly factor BamB
MIHHICTVLAAVATMAVPADWPSAGADAGSSYFNPDEKVLNASTVGKVRLRWTAPRVRSSCPAMSGPALVGPVVADGLVLTQDTSGLTARKVADGRPVWREKTVFADRRAYHIVVSGRTVVVTSAANRCRVGGGDTDGIVAAFDLATGKPRWQRSPSTDAAQVTVVRGTVIVSGHDYGTEPAVDAYRLADGKAMWSRGDGSNGAYTLFSTIPVGGDVLISHHGEPSRFDAVTGQMTAGWPASWTPLTAYADWLLIGDSDDWSLKALRPAGDKVAWSLERVSKRIATDGRRVYLGIGNSLEAYEIPTGQRAWAVNLGAHVGQPIRAGGLVYAPVAGRPPAVRTASTGAKVNTPALPGLAAVAGGRLFGAGPDGLRAYGL